MRLFVAVDVPAAVKDAIESDVVAPLRDAMPDARWTRREGRHLTLKFLGEVADSSVDAVGEALRAVGGEAFEAAFEQVGGFPSLRRPRVLWVGIGPGADPMAGLASGVERALSPLGFEAEKRPFQGHLTLARFKRPQPIGELPPVEVPSDVFGVHAFVLFRSQLHPKGARYTALERFALGG